MDRVTRTAGAYFLLQALLVAAWWALLALRPELRAHFQADTQAALLAFWLPDLAVLAGASLAAGGALLRRLALGPPAAVAAAAACAYATLYCLAASLGSDRGWWGVAAMAPAAVLSAALAVAVQPPARALLRQSRPAPARRLLARTGAQITVFWSVLLLVVPVLLVRLQGELGIPFLRFTGQAVLASTLFAALSVLGLWTGWAMSVRGEGTPLPLASARRLVVTGLYAHVRNPMAVAGLGQGMAVALLSGSVVVAGYVLLGSALWQWVARPLEEEDLARWFGEEYERYRAAVPCWIPRRIPYAAPAAPSPALR